MVGTVGGGSSVISVYDGDEIVEQYHVLFNGGLSTVLYGYYVYDENETVIQSIAVVAEDFDGEYPIFELMVLDDHIDFDQYTAYSMRASTTERLITTYSYDANGNRILQTNANGTSTTYLYNKANLVTTVVNKQGDTILSGHGYTYALDGNIISETTDGVTTTYAYDGLGRLTSESKNGTIISYTYDANGNRATMTKNGVTTTYTYDANNRLLTESKAGDVILYQYDANGNTLRAVRGGDGVGAYTYNLFGNQVSYTPTGVVFTSYTYRPDGLRHSIGNTVHLWDGENIVADIVGNSITTYIRGLTLLYANDENEIYYHFNAHGDVVVLTDEDGTKEKSYSYNAFGVEEDPSALDDNPFRYCGEYFDKVNEKIYLRARYYDANQGRFTQQDGWVYVCQDIPSSLNLYTYCWNNPIRFRDYSGNFPFETIFDVASLCFSVVEFVVSPNLVTLGNVAWDLGSIFMPYVPGSYVKKGTKLLAIASDKVNDIIQIMNRAKNTAEKIDVFLENQRYIVGSYKNIKKVLKSLGANLLELGYEVHHLIEKRFEKILGIKNTDDILSIVLDNETHDKITAALRGIIGYANDHKDRTTLTANAQDVWKAIVEVYEKFGLKDYLPMLKEYLLQNAENVGKIFDWRGY